MIDKETILELIRLKDDGSLYHRESRDLEFKEQFNLAGLAEYFKDFSAFANNVGGYIIFGVKDSPRTLIGLNARSVQSFEEIDPGKITGFLLDIFSSEICWEQEIFLVSGKKFGVFYIYESSHKPIIAKKDEGKNQEIRSGEVYYRYAGRTQKIQFSELNFMIEQRIKRANDEWSGLIGKIAKIGPSNAAILDTERGLIEKGEKQVLVIDEGLIKKIRFIREGSFKEDDGEIALKLIGDVQPMNSIEVVKTVQKRLTDEYPLTCAELLYKVGEHLPNSKQGEIYAVIKENNLKADPRYSAYNFRSKKQEVEYKEKKVATPTTPSIYNNAAVEFIVKVLKTKRN